MRVGYSYEKVPYPTRPSKQAERRLFIEVLNRLAKEGLPIQDYTYIGMGSVFYSDFILFHRYLYISDMICAEHSPDVKRMQFNQPYKFVKVRNDEIATVVPDVRRGRKYLVWLDYDSALDGNKLDDVGGFLRRLDPGSVFIVTVESEFKVEETDLTGGTTLRELEDRACTQGTRAFERYLGRPLRRSDLTEQELPKVYSQILREKARDVLCRKGDFFLFQLFNYFYSDGTQMLTYGGVVCDSDLHERLSRSPISTVPCVEKGRTPRSITLPPLTQREKEWIDARIGGPRVLARRLPFEISASSLKTYLELYRHYPSFVDAMS